MEPRERFPDLVWRIIFAKIEDEKDRFNFLWAHPYFQAEFETKYAELGFSFVLPVLLDYFEKKTPDWSWELNKERRESILACRLVSRKCSEAVDNWLQSYWDNETNPPRILCKEDGLNSTYFSCRSKIQEFTEHFGELQDGRMPILSRSIHILIPLKENDGLWEDGPVPVEEEEEDYERIKGILTEIGEGVKVLRLQFELDIENNAQELALEEIERTRIEAYRSLLELVPNIKKLNTSWDSFFALDLEEEHELLDFPKLPHLVQLCISSPLQQRHDLIDLAPFEQYFPQLIHLDLLNLDCWKHYYARPGTFPNLRHLFINVEAGFCDDHRGKLLAMCRKLFAPKLESFSVHFFGIWSKNAQKDAKWMLHEFVKMLNKTYKKKKGKWVGSQGKEGVAPHKLKFKRV